MIYFENDKSRKGFTLIEMIIVVAIITTTVGLSIPFLQSFRASSDLYTNSDTILKTLRRARQQSIVGQNSGSWGVYFDTSANDIILYKGNDYNSRDTSFDQVTNFSDEVSFITNFSDDITFNIYSGIPSVTGLVTTTNTYTTQVVSVSTQGLIQINE